MLKCWMCGNEATVFPEINVTDEKYYELLKVGCVEPWDAQGYSTSKHQRGYCEACYPEYEAQRRTDRAEYVRLKKKLMIERAVRTLEKQKLDIYDYQEAIEAVSEFSAENADKFDSAQEVIAAIILLENEIQAKTQYKVGRYRIDFLLPSLKIALEIDGDLHAHKLYHDNQRDIDIRQELGADWEVVRIKTEYLEQNAEMLIEAIKAVKHEKQKLRRENGGILPEWYSKRERATKPKKQNYGDEMLL